MLFACSLLKIKFLMVSDQAPQTMDQEEDMSVVLWEHSGQEKEWCSTFCNRVVECKCHQAIFN